MSSQGQVLRLNSKKAIQWILIIKQELTYVQGETYTLLVDHAQARLYFILRVAQPIFSINYSNT